jgi:lipase maturation factor 1
VRIACEILIRGLGAILVLAAGSWLWQAPGLVGARGVTPGPPGSVGGGVLCVAVGLALVARRGFEAPLLLVGWATWLRVVDAGGIWLSFQWDNLLVEALLTAVLVARWGRGPITDPPVWAWAVVWLLVARLMFFGGLAKLLSGDPSWWDGTALTWHFWTQPLPNPLSPLVWTAPRWVSQLGVGLTHVVEIGLPWAILLGWRGRAVAAAGFVLLMVLLLLTGNFGYFQLLAIVLSLTLVDDRVWARLGAALPDRPPAVAWPLAPIAVSLALLAILQGLVSVGVAPEPAVSVIRATDPWRTVNRYGLFATMTRQRHEITLEVSDGAGWHDWPFRWKPGDPRASPPWSAPHLPRLEWRLWFAALGTCERNRWVLRLERLVQLREPTVVRLLGPDPLDGAPIAAVRTLRWDYHPATGGADVWTRELLGPYCPYRGVP